MNSKDKEDLFISLNPFRTMKSGARNNLFCINAIAVDVDYKKKRIFKDLEPFQVIQLLEDEFFDKRIPTPTHIEYGNQIRLIYCVETCYIPKHRDNVLILARRISEVFAEELKDFGAEKQNIESYIRVPNSINSKNGSTVKIFKYENSIRYTLRELQELWLEELPKWYKKKKGRVKANNKVVKLHNVFTLNSNRIRDLEKIQEWLNEIGQTDLRVRMNFLYRNFTLVKIKYQNGKLTEEDFKYAEEQMLKFNSKFIEPCRPHVIARNTRNVNTNQYLYKNETLLNYLELSWEKCEELELQSIYKPKTREEWDRDYYKKNSKTKINKSKEQYKNSLKAKGKLTKKEEVSQRRAKIKDLLSEGLSQKEIYKQLNISKRTCINDVNYLKEQGLI
ncbi:replication protein [Clostridium perfringens D str. JGS1721]|uniref:Replication protein n=1 Tax=Clostridium perfringens D str. JGS1721 TaxID=488537 RepID=B1V828_CLOPF|nr:helix-turn-helix domain-containing protein [Clostridium perfringens]EDT70033.1 replication protein [Clostridium perfringens D str. JGS1721]